MPAAAEVRPAKWTNVTDLFDNGEYSVISGVYDNGTQRVLGERWNGDESDPQGFPKLFGNPVWYVVPGFLDIAILHALLDELARPNVVVPSPDSLQRYRTAILGELEVRLRG
jgi:hypothetical protein